MNIPPLLLLPSTVPGKSEGLTNLEIRNEPLPTTGKESAWNLNGKRFLYQFPREVTSECLLSCGLCCSVPPNSSTEVQNTIVSMSLCL